MSNKREGIGMFCGAFRKTLGLLLVALGVGIVLAIILPVWAWIAIIAICVVILGIYWFLC